MYSRLNYKQCNASNSLQECSENFSDNEHKNKDIVNNLQVIDKNVVNLTEKQCKIIQETFKVYEKNGVDNTLKVFIRMFIENPEYKYIWPQFRQIPDSSFILSSSLRQHAIVYLGGLKSMIENVYDKEKIEILVKKIAYAHIKWEIKKRHVDNMVPELLFVLKDILPNYNKDIEDAWRSLYTIIGNLLEKSKKDQKNEKLLFHK
uniref:GLOBIN domain-containing protein n=1 Tax=Strongyloides papillosus TaxID=174720 RepID=A0A0N5B3B9_STREA